MASELLFVPFKKGSDIDIVKPLKNLIHSTYNTGDHHEDYTDALNELSRLRANAIWKVFEKSSLDVIYNYHDQLASLESKLPPQEVQIPFKWKDAFDKGSLFGGRMSLTISSLAYERMCILFNIGAMQSLIASQQPVESEDSLKQAAKLFQQAAGVFSFLKANIMMAVHQETTPDLHPETLDALAKLMLAQAQEVIAYKCIRDEMKESMVAKVCAHCDELYTDALRAMQKEQLKSLWERDWLTVMQSKQMMFRGLAQMFQAAVCRANKSVGEEIARLQVAEELLKAAAARAGGASAAEHATRAARQLAAARKDNDFIYHERVPEPAALEPVARAAIAKPLGVPARWAGARELFAALEPLAVQQALAAAGARRGELVAAEISKLRDATQLLNSILASLNLPACIEPAPGAGALPDSIRARAAAVRAAGGLAELARLMAELPELLQRNRDILDEAERLLREEAEADAALRTQFGARWSRTDSAKLTEAFRTNADKYRQIIDNAVRADNIVQQKFAQHRDNIALLSGSEGDITAGVPEPAPAQAELGAAGDVAARRLRALMEDVETLKAERDAIEAELKDTTVDLREQFLAALAADGCVDEPALSAGALGAALAPLARQAGATLERQAALLADVQAAHAALMAARGGASGRDNALGQLCAAADAFQELTANLNEGIKFYNDLTQLLVAFQNKVSDFCFARKTEKDELLKDLTQEAARGSVRPAPGPPPLRAGASEVGVAITALGYRYFHKTTFVISPVFQMLCDSHPSEESLGPLTRVCRPSRPPWRGASPPRGPRRPPPPPAPPRVPPRPPPRCPTHNNHKACRSRTARARPTRTTRRRCRSCTTRTPRCPTRTTRRACRPRRPTSPTSTPRPRPGPRPTRSRRRLATTPTRSSRAARARGWALRACRRRRPTSPSRSSRATRARGRATRDVQLKLS